MTSWKNWSSFGSSSRWVICWDYSSISISGKMVYRCDCSFSDDEDSYVCFAIDVTLTNKVRSIWVSSISNTSNMSGMESWSSGSKMV